MSKSQTYYSPDYSQVCTIPAVKKGKIKKRKKSKVKKVLLIFFVIITLLILLSYLILRAVTPKIVDICNAKINSSTKIAINSAVLDVLSKSIKYSDLVKIEKDGAGTVTLIEANSILVNQLARDTAKAVQKKLIDMGTQEVKIPLGQLTGIDFLANRGQIISININPYPAVNCDFTSEFESAGINQTRHKLSILVIANVQIILPAYTGTIKTEAEVLVAESLIVGKVPEVYLNMKTLGGSSLDLTP